MNTSRDNQTRALLAALIANLIWGTSFMVTKIALSHTSPSMLLSARFIASFLIMTLLLIVGAGRIDLKGKPVGLFLLMGLCEPVIYFIAETNGIKYTTSSFSSLIISLIPVMTAVLSAVLIHEVLTLKRLSWIMFSVLGVIIITVNQSGEGVITLKGILYLLVAMVSASIFTILSRKTSEVFTSFERTYIMMLMGCVCFTAKAVIENGSGYGAALVSAVQDKYVILPVLFLSVICSVTAFFCMNYAMTYLEVGRAVVFTNIIPIVSVIAGTLILGEPFSLIYAVGIVVILVGLYMTNKVS